MAQRLAAGFTDHPCIELPWPVDANELFPVIPGDLRVRFREAGLEFYDWPAQSDMTRFVTHFATDPKEIELALEIIASTT